MNTLPVFLELVKKAECDRVFANKPGASYYRKSGQHIPPRALPGAFVAELSPEDRLSLASLTADMIQRT